MFRLVYILMIVLFADTQVLAQNSDTVQFEQNNFPLVIGSIGFATDSMEIVVGKVPLGEVSNFSLRIYNFGTKPITFTNGKSNRFVTVNFQPPTLLPSNEGTMNIALNVDAELDFGEFVTELSVVTNDPKNPYKFMNLIMEVMEGSGNKATREMLDTIPAISFDHYNYDFGHFVRGRRDYHSYIIKNIGGIPLVIEKIETPKGVKIMEKPEGLILPGKEAIIRIQINSHGRVGIIHHSVLVYSNDPNNSLVILGIHGSVKVYPSHKKTSVQCNGEQRY